MTEQADLTRWNRARLRRIRYVDGNAATFLETLRATLGKRLPDWQPGLPPSAAETPAARLARLEQQYDGPRGDLLWELTRAFARACAVLADHIDAFANEMFLDTAGEWESLRRLAQTIGYTPAPASSATTAIWLQARPGTAGTVPSGMRLQHVPAAGGAPLVFETLDSVPVDARRNAIRLVGHDRNPAVLDTAQLTLDRQVPGLRPGDPVVIEDAGSGRLLPRIASGVSSGPGSAILTLDSPVTADENIACGDAVVHLRPAARFGLTGPIPSTWILRDSLRLCRPPAAGIIEAGTVIHIWDGINDGAYRIAAEVAGADIRCPSRVEPARMLAGQAMQAGPVTPIAAADLQTAKIRPDPYELAGQGRCWSMLLPGNRMDLFNLRRIAWQLPSTSLADPVPCDVIDATYPMYLPEATDPAHGRRTRIVFALPEEVSNLLPEQEWDQQLRQAGLYLPLSAGLPVDVPLGTNGQPFPASVLCGADPGIRSGDLVLVRDGAAVAARADRSGPPTGGGGAWEIRVAQWSGDAAAVYHRATTSAYAAFTVRARLDEHALNPTPLTGSGLELTEQVSEGQDVLVEREGQPALTFLARVTAAAPADGGGSRVTLDRELHADDGYLVGTTVVHGNVVRAGHGERRPERVLGSGDGTTAYASYLVHEPLVATVPDATAPHGARLDIEVLVDGQPWKLVDTLAGSGPADAHCFARLTEDGGLLIGFGDGRNGRRVPAGVDNVRIRYRAGAGAAGNQIPPQGLRPVDLPPLITAARQPLSPAGGDDAEDLTSLRTRARAMVRALERGVTLDDIAALTASYRGIEQATALPASGPARDRRPVVRVVVVPVGADTVAGPLGQQLHAYLAAHATPAVDILPPEAYHAVLVPIDVIVDLAPGAEPNDVKAAVRRAVPGQLGPRQRRLGQPLRLSEVYAVAEAVAGVAASTCSFRTPPGDPHLWPARPDELVGCDESMLTVKSRAEAEEGR